MQALQSPRFGALSIFLRVIRRPPLWHQRRHPQRYWNPSGATQEATGLSYGGLSFAIAVLQLSFGLSQPF